MTLWGFSALLRCGALRVRLRSALSLRVSGRIAGLSGPVGLGRLRHLFRCEAGASSSPGEPAHCFPRGRWSVLKLVNGVQYEWGDLKS